MPTKKRSLTVAEQLAHEAAIRQLRAGKCDVPVSQDFHREHSRLKIEFVPWQENVVCNLPGSGLVYVIWIILTALRSGIILRGCELQSSWDPDLDPDVDPYDIQCLSKILGCLPDRRDILNHQMKEGLRLDRPGDMFQGVLFARGAKQVPNTYRTDTRAPVTLRFYDQMDRDYDVQAQLAVQRMTWPRIRYESTGNSHGLFEPMEPRKIMPERRAVRMIQITYTDPLPGRLQTRFSCHGTNSIFRRLCSR